MWRLFFILLSSMLMLWADRCHSYIQDVKLAHFKVFGVDYPYWYGVGQLKQESGCRDIVSLDGVGSQGLAQITFRVWKNYLFKKDIYSLSSVKHQLKAQAYIMKSCKKQAYSSHLWVAYQIYNGGSLVNKEIAKARKKLHIREVPHDIARLFCKRKVIRFKNGQTINACDINYEYSVKVFVYGRRYSYIQSKRYRYW